MTDVFKLKLGYLIFEQKLFEPSLSERMKVRPEDMVTKFNAEDEGKFAPQYKLWILLLFLVVPWQLTVLTSS